MVYCSRCGQKNPEGAKFCNSCGASLIGPIRGRNRRAEDQCEEECSGKKSSSGMNLWTIILILVAIGIIISILSRVGIFGISRIFGGIPYWDIFALLIVLVIIIYILKSINERKDDGKI